MYSNAFANTRQAGTSVHKRHVVPSRPGPPRSRTTSSPPMRLQSPCTPYDSPAQLRQRPADACTWPPFGTVRTSRVLHATKHAHKVVLWRGRVRLVRVRQTPSPMWATVTVTCPPYGNPADLRQRRMWTHGPRLARSAHPRVPRAPYKNSAGACTPHVHHVYVL